MTSSIANDASATATEQLLIKVREVRESLSPAAHDVRYRLMEIESRLREDTDDPPHT